MTKQRVKLLLIEDAEDEIGELLSSIESAALLVESSSTTIAAARELDLKSYDASLLNSGGEAALSFIRECQRAGSDLPIITVSPSANEGMEALRSGASDALLRDKVTPHSLAGSISHAIQRVRDLARQKEYAHRYLALADKANEIIYSHDLDGNYTSMNKAGERLTGFSREEALRLNIAQVVAPEYRELVDRMITEKLGGDESSLYEIEIITKSGRRLPLEVSTHLIFDGGKPVGIQGVARDITERRARQAVLVESEQRYKQLVNEATDIIYRTDLNGHFTFVNPIASKAMQRPRKELIGLHFLELIHEDYRKRAADFYKRQVKGVIPSTYFEFPAMAKDGTEIWIGQNVQLLLRDSEPVELQAVARDITARKKVEAQLMESERRYRSLFDASPHSQWVYDLETMMLLAVNEAAIRTYGYSREELLCMKASDLWGGEDILFSAKSAPGGVVIGGKPARTRKHLKKDGSAIDVEVTSHPFTLEGRRSAIVIATDVTERVRAEAERQVMVDVIQSVTLTEDLDELLKFIHESLKRVLYAENCFVALYNQEEGRFEMPFFVDSSDPICNTRELKKSCAAYVFRTGQPSLITPEVFEELTAQGEVKLVGARSASWLGVPLKTRSETIGVLAVQHYEDENAYAERDLEFLSSIGGQIALAIERKRTEEGLRLSEERFSKAFDFMPLSMTLTSLKDLRVIDVNKSFLVLNGYAHKDVIGRTAQELNFWGEPAAQADFVERLKSQRSVRDQEIQVHDRNGNLRTCLISAEIIDLHGGECVLTVTNDITEHRALEEQLRHSQRMEATGQLAGGVAHDFNNMLTVITGYSELSLRRLGINHPARKDIEQIQKAGTRATVLTRQLLAFSRKQMLEAKLLDLNALVADMGKMLQRLIGENIHLITILKPGLGTIKADPGQIEQVLLNLVVNARDALCTGGSITIQTENAHLNEAYAGSHVTVVPGPYVKFAVTDTGSGMDPATQKRIFEPFFTTKEIGKGTGLGLSTVYGIVKQSDGYIWVYSEVGKGTTFKVYLPRVDEPITSEALAVCQDELCGDETILLVEDEEQVRNLSKNTLEENGYTVMVAEHGADGLRICEHFVGRIHLLITDVVMPFMDGCELAEKVRALRPETKVLYVSGYTDDSVVRYGVLEEHVAFLQKPFTPTSLAQKVREVLDQRSSIAF